MPNPANEKAELVRHEVAYQGYFKIGRYFFRHSLHAGGESALISREVFERGQAGAVLPYDPARDEVVLIKQWDSAGSPLMFQQAVTRQPPPTNVAIHSRRSCTRSSRRTFRPS